MVKIRQHIALFFLLLISIISLPKSWSHECHDHAGIEVTDSHQSFTEHCHTCDTDFILQKIDPVHLCVSDCPQYYEFAEQFVSAPALQNTGSFFNKAPPLHTC